MTSDLQISIITPNLHSPIVDQTIESALGQETDLPFDVILVGMDKFNLVDQYPEVKFLQMVQPVGAT